MTRDELIEKMHSTYGVSHDHHKGLGPNTVAAEHFGITKALDVVLAEVLRPVEFNVESRFDNAFANHVLSARLQQYSGPREKTLAEKIVHILREVHEGSDGYSPESFNGVAAEIVALLEEGGRK